jgi:hypothetical protein
MAMSRSALLHILAASELCYTAKEDKRENPDGVFIFESNLHQDEFVSSI